MFDPSPGRLFLAATLLPLAGTLALLLAGTARRFALPLAAPTRLPGYFAVAVMAFATVVALAGVTQGDFAGHTYGESVGWVRLGPNPDAVAQLRLGYRVDALTAVMVPMVCAVTTLVMLFSLGYLRDEANPTVTDHVTHTVRRGRFGLFFLELLLFAFSMLFLLVGDNLLHVFVGWELVGVSSYLLIGFYTERPAAIAAATKAFVMNRVGDAGLLVGIFAAWQLHGTLDLVALTHAPPADGWLPLVMGLGLFAGCVGKSAQWPLHTWLPDAMEGPTPVSALIHAATMVAAGVYLLARCDPLFTPDCLLAIQGVGAGTMLYAAVVAVTQTDIKRVLAYSTMSQLGLMVFAVGIGAWTAGVFHLVTHAAFKALLFLGAGSVIHALHHEQDLRAMGGLRRRMPLTALTTLVGVLAISGVPFLSGWASKELVLGESLAFARSGQPLAWLGVLPFVGASLTAYYMLRLWLLAFAGRPRGDAANHAHESPPSMALPLLALAALTAVAGLGLPVWEADRSALANFLSLARPGEPPAPRDGHALTLALGAGCFVVGFAVALARHRAGHLVPTAGPRGTAFDAAYRVLFSAPTLALGRLVAARDKGQRLSLDAAMSLPAEVAPRLADRLRRTQTGNVRHYVLALAVCLLGALSALTLLR